MRSSPVAALLLVLAPAVAALGCHDEPAARTGPEPMRTPARSGPARPLAPAEGDATSTGEPGSNSPDSASDSDPSSAPLVAERPRADPAIERTLDLIGASELRFVDPPSDPDSRPTEYTAEQFASMLRTKWDWIGYDLTELDPWLDGVATRSFKSGLGYQVVLANGTTTEFRPWLDAQLERVDR